MGARPPLDVDDRVERVEPLGRLAPVDVGELVDRSVDEHATSLSPVRHPSDPHRAQTQAVNPTASASVRVQAGYAQLTFRRRRISAVLVIVGLAVALSACSSSGSKGGSADTKGKGSAAAGISIANLTFTAGSVKAGSTVTVTNNDTPTHTVTSDDGTSFDVTVDAGKTATFTAPAAGYVQVPLQHSLTDARHPDGHIGRIRVSR